MRARPVRHLPDTEGEYQLKAYTLGAYSPRPGPRWYPLHKLLGSVNVVLQLGLNLKSRLRSYKPN